MKMSRGQAETEFSAGSRTKKHSFQIIGDLSRFSAMKRRRNPLSSMMKRYQGLFRPDVGRDHGYLPCEAFQPEVYKRTRESDRGIPEGIHPGRCRPGDDPRFHAGNDRGNGLLKDAIKQIISAQFMEHNSKKIFRGLVCPVCN